MFQSSNFSSITEEYKIFAEQKDACKMCEVCKVYGKVVQSEGNAKDPTFMITGEAAGQDEVAQGIPFIGRAGKRIREELNKYPETFNKKTTIISNMIPCRPKDNKFPQKTEQYEIYNNEYPTKINGRELVKYCQGMWLDREIKLLSPKIIITLGAQSLFGIRGEVGITNCRGNWLYVKKYKAWTFATYHPSYVLRCMNDSTKDFVPKQFSEDIEKVSRTWLDIVKQCPQEETFVNSIGVII